tara:strand:+ start:1766 stop:2194 length:429 start_codon:yes stop_codon:yes gene_type:complete
MYKDITYEEKVGLIAAGVLIGLLVYGSLDLKKGHDQDNSNDTSEVISDNQDTSAIYSSQTSLTNDNNLIPYHSDTGIGGVEHIINQDYSTTNSLFPGDYLCIEFDSNGDAIGVQGVFEADYEAAVARGLDCQLNDENSLDYD